MKIFFALDSFTLFKFTPKPTNKNFELGSSGKIHCKANGSVKIYWIKDVDENLPDDVEDVNGTLIFNNVASNNKGFYSCFASNADGEKIEHKIEVGILPQFEIVPSKYLEVVELQSVYLDCVGSDNSTVKWDYENTMINSENDERFHIYGNGSLLLHEARQDDSGKYGCTIGNSAGFKRSESNLVIKRENFILLFRLKMTILLIYLSQFRDGLAFIIRRGRRRKQSFNQQSSYYDVPCRSHIHIFGCCANVVVSP